MLEKYFTPYAVPEKTPSGSVKVLDFQSELGMLWVMSLEGI